MLNRHKHILVFISILGILLVPVGDIMTIQGRFAKGDDLPVVTYPEYISVWDDEPTSVDHPYNANTWFDESLGLWEDIYNDGRFNNFTWSDANRASVEYVVSNFVSTNPEYTGVGTSYFDDIVDYIMANESQFGIYYASFPSLEWWGGNHNQAPWGDIMSRIYIPPEFVDALEDYIIDTYYTVPDAGVTINGHKWVKVPASVVLKGDYVNTTYSLSQGSYDDVYVTLYGVHGTYGIARGAIVCAFHSYGSSQVGISVNRSYSGSIASGYYATIQNANANYGIVSATGFTSNVYSSSSEALADFFGYPIVANDGTPVSNGDVYFRKDGINNSNYLQFSFPALPVQDSKSVSEYYYTTYGDTFEDSETVIDNSVYNYNITTVYPLTYTNDVPLWLVQRTVDTPSLEVVSADYSLPSVELEEGDASFWQGLYEALPVSVSVILLGVILCWLIFTLI